jgi:predicted RNase H-like nuclease (RuvC/YqgF family)
MKKAVYLLRKTCRDFGGRASSRGDPAYWENRAKYLKEELEKLKADQESLRQRNLKLQREVKELKVRMDEFADRFSPTTVLKRRCASPILPSREREEEMSVDVEVVEDFWTSGHGIRPRI